MATGSGERVGRPLHLSVVGAGTADPELFERARAVGRAVAAVGAVVVCGGLGGVMAGACRGAREAGGCTVGLLPGDDPAGANPWVEIAIPTGLGHARNVLVVQAGGAVLALPGSWGTASEVALALKMGRPVVGVGAWEQMAGVVRVDDPAAAVAEAVRLVRRGRGG